MANLYCAGNQTVQRNLNYIIQPPDLSIPLDADTTSTKAVSKTLLPLDMAIPIWDQSALGACVSEGNCGLFVYRWVKQGKPYFLPSILFVYYLERVILGTTSFDSGANIINGIQVLRISGVCPDSYWTYDISQFTVQPPPAAYAAALPNLALETNRVSTTIAGVKGALNNDNPVVFAFPVFPSFMTVQVQQTGIMPMRQGNEVMIGGHCCVFVGYDDEEQMFWVRNSWGTDWGINGRFKMPYAYLTQFVMETYIMKKVK